MWLQCVVWMRSDLFIDIQHAAQICQFIKNEAWDVSAGVSANVSVNEFNVHGMGNHTAVSWFGRRCHPCGSLIYSHYLCGRVRPYGQVALSPSQARRQVTGARCTVARCTIVAAMLHFEFRAAQRVVLPQEINLNKPNRNFANNRGLAGKRRQRRRKTQMKMEMKMKMDWTRAEMPRRSYPAKDKRTGHDINKRQIENVNGNWQSASGILCQKLSIRSMRSDGIFLNSA